MGNPHRGEASFDSGGTAYRISYSWNAAAELESRTGRTISDVLAHLAEARVSAVDLRGMLWAGLRKHHASVTFEQAGDILDAIGRTEALRLIGVAMRYYYPEMPDPDPDPQSPVPSP